MNVEAVVASQFDDVYPLLTRFENPRMSREDWRRMLFDLPWTTARPERGWVLRHDHRVVGFLGTIFSTRVVDGLAHEFCNLSSWIVDEEHRSASMQLLMPVLALRTHTIVNLSPSPAAWEIFRALGFQPLERAQVLMLPLPRLWRPWDRLHALTSMSAMQDVLPAAGRETLASVAGTLAGQIVLTHGSRHSHVVATRSPWKGPVRVAHVQYASDWDLLWEYPGAVSAGFATVLGTVGLRVDLRHARGTIPWPARVRELPRSHLFRPASSAITPARVDGLFTEAMGQRW